VTRPEELDARGRRLRAALAAVLVRDRARELDLVHQWLDTWAGLGLVVVGMTHQGWDVQLTAYAARDWRANFFPAGIAHSIGGTAWEPTPWRAVQRAAWEALNKAGVEMGDEWTHAESGRECQRIVIVPFCGFDVSAGRCRTISLSRRRAYASCPSSLPAGHRKRLLGLCRSIVHASNRHVRIAAGPSHRSCARIHLGGSSDSDLTWKDHGGPMHRERRRLVSLVCLGTFGVSYRRHSSLRVAPASPETPGAPATADQA
jgi:hypothetical protein